MKPLTAIVVAMLLFVAGAAADHHRKIPAAFGPFVNLKPDDFAAAQTFKATDRIVATYYFYWYDSATKEHIIDGDGSDALTTHPPTLDDFSYKSVGWHRRQLEDMMAAGIDVALPVFWGAPSEHEAKAHLHWSYAGLKPMVEAREQLVREGKAPPRLGLFYDTSTLQYNAWREHIDLTTEFGKKWFYATVRDFYSLVPPKHWAMIDGKPLVLLYAAAFAMKHDQGFVDYLKQEFPKEFTGRVPYLVVQNSFQVRADNVCAWGGALGLKNPGVATLGPGYDHSAVPGRDPLVAERRGGKFYEANWIRFLRRPANIVTIETWNEFHEGTDICESKEYGRQYIELTRKYVDLFKRGWQPPWPKGKYSGSRAVSVALGASNSEEGLRQVDNDDGITKAVVVEGRACRTVETRTGTSRYLYLIVDDSFKSADAAEFTLTVEYFDAAPGRLGVEYDGSDTSAAFGGSYTRSPDSATLAGSKLWKKTSFNLPAARLLNSQNQGSDLRLVIEAPDFQTAALRLEKASRENPPAVGGERNLSDPFVH